MPTSRRSRLSLAGLLVAALLLISATPASAQVFDDLGGGFSGPSVSSDKPDYMPGETVVLTGSGWLPGEHVHVTVNDDVGQTWVRETDVTADEAGAISDTFQLPDSFIARYRVTAVGDASGTAITTFTDGNLKVMSEGGRDFNYTVTEYASTNCTTGAGSPSTKLANAGGSTTGVQDGESLLIAANPTANAPNATAGFSSWTLGTVTLAAGYAATDRTICVVGFQSGSRDLIGRYAGDTTPPTVSSINRAGASPTNTSGTVSWTVTFSESVTGVDAADFALVNSGLGGAPAITTVTGSGNARTVTASTGTGSGTLQLNLADNDSIVDGAGNGLGGTGTGTVGSGGAGNGSFAGQAYTIDRSAPTISAAAVTLPDSSPYTAGTWTNRSVRVTFTCTDSGGSGKATDTASGNTDLTAETPAAGTTVNSTGTCTDNAGNSAAGTSFGPVKIDKTGPTITDLGPTTSPNSNGWYKADVANRFKVEDSLSGLDSDCLAAYPDVSGDRVQSKTTSGESAAEQVTSDACSDEAGNTAAGKDSASFKVDKRAPTITDLGPTTSANGNGWYDADVTNRFKAEDSLSGPDSDCLAAYPDDAGDRIQSKTTSGEGIDLKVSSDPCTDDAGNTAAALDSAPFDVDASSPISQASSPAATNATPFSVDYTAADQAGLSGLTKVELYVRTPSAGSDYVLAATDSSPSPGGGSFSYTPDAGEGTYRFYTLSYDAAGNQESSPVTYDTVTDIETGAPDTTTIFDRTPPETTDDADGDWHNSAVTVTLTPADESGGSGVDKTYYKVDGAATFTEGTSVVIAAPADHSNDGEHTVHYYSTDKAGNEEQARSATVKIDTTAPTVQYISASPAANGNGWRNVDVTATFQGTDNASGFDGPSATKTDTAVTTGEGSNVTVGSPAFTDRAGNTAAAGAAVSDPFKIDKTKPTLNPVVTPNPIILGGAASVASNAADPLSTLDSQSCGSVNTGLPVGPKSVTCTATDKAGNTDSKSVTYGIQFGWNGFLQPINDTAHQTGLTQSRFKLGSTVPAKFVLTNASGQVVQQATNPTFSRTNRLRACDSVGTTEPTVGDLSPDSGASYAWNGTQYHFNWSTKGIKDTGVYRIYANLADGSQRWVDICLW